MVAISRAPDYFSAVERALAEANASPAEAAEMLMHVAMSLQQQPRAPEDMTAAIDLYRMALERSDDDALLAARIRARLGTALMAAPDGGAEHLEAARAELDAALGVLAAQGSDEEVAEGYMNLGLAQQSLVPFGAARMRDAIQSYQRALRTFSKEKHPKDYAVLQNNLAIAFLSVAGVDSTGKMREALAVQAFEDGLAIVNLIDHPNEYAMLQNNLGNALQYAASSHPLANRLRAIEAYDEALKVRTRRTAPQEYANTIANKANCLANLPDDPESADGGNERNLATARALYAEAWSIFREQGEHEKAEAVAAALTELGVNVMPPRSNGSYQAVVQE